MSALRKSGGRQIDWQIFHLFVLYYFNHLILWSLLLINYLWNGYGTLWITSATHHHLRAFGRCKRSILRSSSGSGCASLCCIKVWGNSIAHDWLIISCMNSLRRWESCIRCSCISLAEFPPTNIFLFLRW